MHRPQTGRHHPCWRPACRSRGWCWWPRKLACRRTAARRGSATRRRGRHLRAQSTQTSRPPAEQRRRQTGWRLPPCPAPDRTETCRPESYPASGRTGCPPLAAGSHQTRPRQTAAAAVAAAAAGRQTGRLQAGQSRTAWSLAEAGQTCHQLVPAAVRRTASSPAAWLQTGCCQMQWHPLPGQTGSQRSSGRMGRAHSAGAHQRGSPPRQMQSSPAWCSQTRALRQKHHRRRTLRQRVRRQAASVVVQRAMFPAAAAAAARTASCRQPAGQSRQMSLRRQRHYRRCCRRERCRCRLVDCRRAAQCCSHCRCRPAPPAGSPPTAAPPPTCWSTQAWR